MLTVLTLIALSSLQKVSFFSLMVFLFGTSHDVAYTFDLHLKVWSMNKNAVSEIWVGMFTTNIHLLQFKIQSHY